MRETGPTVATLMPTAPRRRSGGRRPRPGGAAVVAVATLLGVLAAPAAAATSRAPTTPVVTGSVEAPGLTPVPAPPVADREQTGIAGVFAAALDSPTASPAFVAPDNTDFVVDFAGSVDAASRDVVTTAAGIWSAVLDTSVPITVDVAMAPLDPGYLGAAGPTTAHYGHAAFPEPDVLYPVALANQLAGQDLDPATHDIELVLSSTQVWDKQVDGAVSPTGQSMLSVAVHELAHGLGHTSWVRSTATGWQVNFELEGVTAALAYDRRVTSENGSPITSMSSSALGAAVTSPLVWAGDQGRAANAGTAPELHSPPVFETGSSVGHLDEAGFGAAVMTPFLALGEVHTRVPDLTRAMLADTGWSVSEATDATPPGSSGSVSPAESADAFVEAVVNDFVGRPPTAEERARWREHLLGGGSRAAVTAAFAFSDEWIGVLVDGLYQSALGRGPDASGRAHWVEILRSGHTPVEVASSFYASDEYFRRAGGTVTAWVGDLYTEVLGREADGSGLAFWVERSRHVPRGAIAHDFHQSSESRRDRVARLFDRLLGRPPDPGGWSYWAGVLANGRDIDLAAFLAASDEYYQRAATR